MSRKPICTSDLLSNINTSLCCLMQGQIRLSSDNVARELMTVEQRA
jgi:hypothetical protein